MATAIKEMRDVVRKAQRHRQTLQAGMGLLSSFRHAMYGMGENGGRFIDEAKECAYEVDQMLDAIAERVVDEIERRRQKRQRRAV